MANSLNKVTTKSILDATIATADIADDAVTSAKIADDAITSALIADDAIVAAGIADNAVVTAAINADAVTGAKIADDAVGAEHIEVLDSHLQLADSCNVKIGTGDDLQLYHDGSSSYITNATGNTFVKTLGGQFHVRPSGDEEGIIVKPNADVELFYNNSKKLETTSGGVALTGELDVTSASTAANDSEPVATFTTEGHCQLRLDGDGNKWSVMALDSAAAGDHFIIYDKNNSAERLRIESGGNVKINDGDLIIGTSGHGIDFGATGDATGATSEKLDDYEEGEYQPTITAGSGSWSTSTYTYLAYTKIGRLVHVSGYLNITADNSANGDVRVSLPFVASNSLSQAADSGALTVSLRAHNGSANLYNVVGGISDGNSFFEMVAVAGNGSHVWIGQEHCDSSWNLRVGGCYLTDS